MLRREDIVIDPEFRDLMPVYDDGGRLDTEIELRGWSEEPITVWKNHAILLDGHRRFAIWEKRDDDGPQIRELAFATREAAMHWMVNFAFARRNLTDEEQRYLLGRKYTAEKKCPGGDGSNQYTTTKEQRPQNGAIANDDGPRKRTREIIAEREGVSRNTVERAEKFANAVDDLDKRGVVSKADILSGAVKVPASTVVAASKAATPEEAKAVLASKPLKKEDAPTQNDQLNGMCPPAEQRKRKFALERAEDAINALKRVPTEGGYRDFACKEVASWIKTNSKRG